MRRTGLDFAPGTTDDCKRLIGTLFQPDDILAAYRNARASLRTGDIVLVGSEQDPSGFQAWERTRYVKHIRDGVQNRKMPPFFAGIAAKTPHSIVQLPFESDAMWLVITRHQDMPIMAVVYATQFDVEAAPLMS